jgi:anti-anti-sigma factor
MGGPDLASEQTAGATADVTDTRMTIAVVGELDLARECELLNLVLTLELRPGTTIELDLSEVTFVDSYGLKSIVKAHAYLRGIRCELILVRSQPQLLRLLELVGLTERLVKQDDGR